MKTAKEAALAADKNNREVKLVLSAVATAIDEAVAAGKYFFDVSVSDKSRDRIISVLFNAGYNIVHQTPDRKSLVVSFRDV